MAASAALVVASSVLLRRFDTTSPARLRSATSPRIRSCMPGMNSGVNVSDPVVAATFKAALVHRGLIALLIFVVLGLVLVVLGLAWISIRGVAARRGRAAWQQQGRRPDRPSPTPSRK